MDSLIKLMNSIFLKKNDYIPHLYNNKPYMIKDTWYLNGAVIASKVDKI
tara:strand:+ start:7784 stop:7930 length:147 start_codon:yes stop_codon:yes gene_type:complete